MLLRVYLGIVANDIVVAGVLVSIIDVVVVVVWPVVSLRGRCLSRLL